MASPFFSANAVQKTTLVRSCASSGTSPSGCCAPPPPPPQPKAAKETSVPPETTRKLRLLMRLFMVVLSSLQVSTLGSPRGEARDYVPLPPQKEQQDGQDYEDGRGHNEPPLVCSLLVEEVREADRQRAHLRRVGHD